MDIKSITLCGNHNERSGQLIRSLDQRVKYGDIVVEKVGEFSLFSLFASGFKSYLGTLQYKLCGLIKNIKYVHLNARRPLLSFLLHTS